METAHANRLVIAAERSAAALERIATALEAANRADPLQLLQEALEMEQNTPVNLDDALSAPDDWRLR